MNANDRKAARKAITHALREYAKARREVVRVQFSPTRGMHDFRNALYKSSLEHNLFLGARSFAHEVGLITWNAYMRLGRRADRIREAKVTRGVSNKEPCEVA